MDEAKPLGHREQAANLNLGFGFLYYGLVGSLRPGHVLVIGSGYGFSVVCLALGLKDNGVGALTLRRPVVLVGPQRPDEDHRRRRFLARPGSGPRHFAHFGVEDLVTHYKHTTEEFFARYDEFGMPQIDLAFIDGNHSYPHVQHDVVAVLKHCHKNVISCCTTRTSTSASCCGTPA